MKRPHVPGNTDFPTHHSISEEDSREPLDAVARFQSAAEAGYFAHELKMLQNVPTLVRAVEEFDAVSGHWSTGFVLFVPSPQAEEAALTLQDLVRQSENEDASPVRASATSEREVTTTSPSEPFDPFVRDEEFEYPEPINWVPIVVTLAAGSLAFWGVKQLWEPARPQPAAPADAPRDVLWDIMKTPQGRKWVQQDADGRRIRELEIHPDGSEAVLREDHDGDEFFEKTRRVKRP